MDQDVLAQRRQLATTQALEFTHRFVWNVLPAHCQYLLRPGLSGPKPVVQAGQLVFPDDIRKDTGHVGPLAVEGVVAYLWRNGLIPLWINLNVYAADESTTYLELHWCGDFTDRDHFLYYQDSDTCPIQVLGPPLPPRWDDERDGKFDLHWRQAAH
jgi:hypothetical protein